MKKLPVTVLSMAFEHGKYQPNTVKREYIYFIATLLRY